MQAEAFPTCFQYRTHSDSVFAVWMNYLGELASPQVYQQPSAGLLHIL